MRNNQTNFPSGIVVVEAVWVTSVKLCGQLFYIE